MATADEKEKQFHNTQQISRHLEANPVKSPAVMRVREYRQMFADSQVHLEELVIFMENQGWKTYGPPICYITQTDGDLKQLDGKPFCQPMVIYDDSEILR